ncbi:thiamine phosphate synthase [Parapedobacter sp. DT-150]|uniref:thiamine phosphate synthase n=1 Tax=Parapedobacter sp. DT-150 TaxID=3396162 RepID=UPI003F19640C
MNAIESFHYITDPRDGYPVVQQAEDVCRGGCRWVQLRMKQASTGERTADAQEMLPVLRRYGAKLIINDDVAVLNEVDADGVHLGAEDMHPLEARKLLGPDKIIGCTANTLDDVLRLSEYDINYIGLGPFRFTATKEKLRPVLGGEGIHRIVAAAKVQGIRIPIIAIGGITSGDVSRLMNTGIAGVAVSNAIHAAIDRSAACRAILAQLTANHPSPVTDHPSPVTDHPSPVTHHRSQTTNHP